MTDVMKLRMGTRKSRLAMIQTELVRDAILEHFPDIEIELVPMSTLGDRVLDQSLDSFGGKGVFTQDLDTALQDGSIDIAVHSAKDMPMQLPDGLALGAVLPRANPGDVLVTASGIPARKLPAGSVIGTSSLRRELQIRRINPQVEVRLLRGNVTTRLEKLRNGEYDGILLAAAGLERLGLTAPEGLFVEYLDLELFLPAPGQGFLGVEIREGELSEIMAAIHDREAAVELKAEREYLTILGGNCNAPCGAYCHREGRNLVMTAMYAGDGVHPLYRSGKVPYRVEDQMTQHGPAGMDCARRLAADLAGQVCERHPVSLVGAGPGNAGLMTERGLQCVRSADVVVYDHLTPASVLNEARLEAELIYVGKRAGHHHMVQEQINALLVENAKAGRYVVRLKGGDPFVFGRGGEEALELGRQGLAYEVVPGVSSVSAVPAHAGIPITHRGMASSFHVMTGHEDAGKEADVLDYAVLAKEEGTLVFLMGLRRLTKIADELIRNGKPAGTPAAVISRGTTGHQRKLISDLGHIAAEASRMGIEPPALTVIGEVASLGDALDWFDRGVLSGKRVLVTGTRYMAKEMECALQPLGAEIISVSLIESRALRTQFLYQALEAIGSFTWLVFTSGNGVDLFFEVLREQQFDLRRLMHLKFAAIGRKTAAALAAHGFMCDFVPQGFSGAELAAEWIPTLGSGERVLLMRAREGSPVLTEHLAAAGIDYMDVPLYETWVDVRRRDELARLLPEVDYVTLCSGSAVQAFRAALDAEGLADAGSARLISIGPTTTQAAKRLGLSVCATADEYTAEGVAAAILKDAEDV